ncbi:hypothetical protein SynA1825c_02783 [Synechococcus sp. A18-25c]|nr:hypothetical protein SynA1825c_02783 [Synechococcus sp. A18-25c]
MANKRQQPYAAHSPSGYPLRGRLNISGANGVESIPESNAANNPCELH